MGIGRCMARRLAELGYRLILAGLDPAKLEAAAEELHEQYGLAKSLRLSCGSELTRQGISLP